MNRPEGLTHACPVIEFSQVTQCFGAWTALEDVSFRVDPGDRLGLIGPSGAGKSTVIHLLNGQLQPTVGEVKLFDRPIAALNPRQFRALQRRIGTVYQQFHLIDPLQVIHNVNAGHLGRWPWWKAVWSLIHPLEVATAQQALTAVGIPEKLYARTDELSGGQQQRVAIARVMVQNPELVLADEPIASLDPSLSQEIMTLLRDLTTHRTLVMSLHDIALAQTYCDRWIGLRRGRVLFDLPPNRVSTELLQDLYEG